MTRVIAAVAFALAATGAEARTCRGDLPPATAPIAAPFWTDSAEFAFLVGHDHVDEHGAMALARRLRGLDGFAELRRAAADWDTLQSRLQETSRRLADLEAVALGLQQHCDALDDVALDPGAVFDSAAWVAGVAALEARIDATIAETRPVLADLARYDALLRGAATAYEAAGHAPIFGMRLGPDPKTLSAGLGELSGRWRALFSDLENARAILPVTPEIGSERPLIAMTAAMTAMLRASAAAQVLSSGSLDVAATARFLTGDYLYDQCPMIADGQWVRLENGYWTNRYGQPAYLGSSVLPDWQTHVDSNFGFPASADLWLFRRVGQGYWLIHNGSVGRNVAALDVINSPWPPDPRRLRPAPDCRYRPPAARDESSGAARLFDPRRRA